MKTISTSKPQKNYFKSQNTESVLKKLERDSLSGNRETART